MGKNVPRKSDRSAPPRCGAFYTADEFDRYVTKLESWRAAQLEKFDAKEAFREKKTAKHGDRAGFEAWLAAEVERNKGAVRVR